MRHQGSILLSRGNFWGFRGSTFHQTSEECHDLQRKQIKINFLKKNALMDIIMLQLSRAKPGNLASLIINVIVNYEINAEKYRVNLRNPLEQSSDLHLCSLSCACHIVR